jgi:cation transport ATPase
VVVALEVARATMRKVKQNLFWAYVYNTLGILIGAMPIVIGRVKKRSQSPTAYESALTRP